MELKGGQMEVEMRDGKTLVIKPESTAEQEALVKFQGGVVSIEDPKPFTPNVKALKIEVAE